MALLPIPAARPGQWSDAAVMIAGHVHGAERRPQTGRKTRHRTPIK